MLKINKSLCLGLLATLVCVTAQAATIEIAPVADARILTFFPDNPEGLGALLSVHTQPGNVQRTLMQFDLSGIPSGGQIDSATLTLYTTIGYGERNPGGLAMNVHAVTAPWAELEVTWNSASAGTPWATAGGDIEPLVRAASTANPAAQAPATWEVTSLVQDWFDATIDNHGLLIQSSMGNELVFDSVNQTDAAFQPKLAVTYSVVPEPNSMTLLAATVPLLVGAVSYRRGRRTAAR